MKKTKVFFLVLASVCSFSLLMAQGVAMTPKDSITLTVESVLSLLRDRELSLPDKKEERRSRIRALINNRFDYKEMSMRSLARHWRERTPEEAKEFVAVFSDLLVSSYIGKLEGYTDEKVTYNKEVLKGNGKYGVVSTTIISKDVDIPIDYKLILRDDKWWVYDVVVEGVSFISTYRSQYDTIIVRESYAGLIQKMKKQLDEVNAM